MLYAKWQTVIETKRTTRFKLKYVNCLNVKFHTLLIATYEKLIGTQNVVQHIQNHSEINEIE